MKKVISKNRIWVTIFCIFTYSQTNAFNGTKTIGASGADYTSITAGLAAANSGGLDGAVIFSLQADYNSSAETFPLTIGSITGASVINTITIRPAATGLSITSNNTTATINLNGAKYIIIDGRVNGTGSTKDLVIANTSTATGGTAIQFINDASNNTIQYTKLSATFGSTTSGVLLFSTTTGTTGNDNNTINYCDIDGKAGVNASPSSSEAALNGIYSLGTNTSTNHYNSNNTISNCNIFDFFNASSGSTTSGIILNSSNTDWVITSNHFYQTATRTPTGTALVYVIYLLNTNGNNFTINNNYIGGSEPSAGGTAWTVNGGFLNTFRGITMNVDTTSTSNVQGNTIRNINFNTSTASSNIPGIFCAIHATAGSINIGTTSGNTIGSASGTGSLTITTSLSGARVYGIGVENSVSKTSISNNTIGSITTNGTSTSISNSFTGIASSSTSNSITISGNTIGSTSTTNSINASNFSTNATTQVVTGINTTGTGTTTISNNTIANLNNNYNPGSTISSVMRGIVNSSGTVIINGNTIRNLSTVTNSSGTTSFSSVIGILNTSVIGTVSITQNIIHTLKNTHATGITTVLGICNNGFNSGTNTIGRNFIHSLSLSTTAAGNIYGIEVLGGTSTYQNNMIRLGIDESGASLSNEYNIKGIDDNSGTNTYYFNTVYIGGTNVNSGSTNTYALYSAVTSGRRIFKNNIFVNDRSNNSGTGIHVACFISGTLPAINGLSSDNNIFFASGTGGVLIRNSSTNYSLNSWRSASNQDLSSHQGNPNFVLATGNSSTVDLHLQGSTVAEGNGILISSISEDYDGSTRSSLTATDIGADAGAFTSIDGSSPNIAFTPISNSSTSNKVLANFAQITDNISVSNTSKPRLYFKKSTENDVFLANNNTANGWKYVMASNSSSPYSFTIDYSLLNSSIATDNVIEYFVVAQDLSNNFNSLPEGATYSTSPPVENINAKPSTVYSYTIKNSSISGSVNVGLGETYTSLTGTSGLFADINSKLVTGNITVNITSDLTEDGNTSLNALGEEPYGSNYTITIQPNSNAMRTISATALSAGVPMINFNGADNIIIDGRNAGAGQFLSFRNTNATAANTGAVIQFTNGSTNSTLRNCIIESNSSSGSIGSITLGATGANSVSILSNTIKDASADNVGANAVSIYSNNSFNTATISSNAIYNFSSNGVLLSSVNDGCTVSANSFYNTSSPTTAQTSISVQAGSNHTISNNYIGGNTSNAGGSAWANSAAIAFKGITTGGSFFNANTIQNNTIQNINLSSTSTVSFIGIEVSSGLATVSSNTIGHTSTSASVIVAGSSSTTGILISSGLNCTINNNLIANLSATGTFSGTTFRGINATGNGTPSISSNIIRNIIYNGTSTSDASGVSGITSTSQGPEQSITKNQVYALESSTSSAATFCIGIVLNSTSGSFIVSKNKIHSLSNTSSSISASIYGIYLSSGNSSVINNMISLTNGANSNGPIMGGIYESSTTTTTHQLYYNSVRIGGTASTTANTSAFTRIVRSTITLKNNIFINERTGGTGKHYAITNFPSSPDIGWSSAASNYNILYSSNSSTVGLWTGDQTLAGIQSISGGDANSKSVDINFNDETNGDLHIAGASIGNANLNGVLIAGITEDFDEQTRPSTSGTPYIGADEVTSSPLPIELLSFNGEHKNEFNLLTWTTASEINSNYFEVERLTNEKTFENIARITATGNSREVNHYQFHDATFSKKNTVDYYRLKLIDRDNSFVYSDVIAISRNDKYPIQVKLYPVPAENTINLVIEGNEENKIDIVVTDLMGKVVYQKKQINSKEIHQINIQYLPRGIYSVSIYGLKESIHQKFLKR